MPENILNQKSVVMNKQNDKYTELVNRIKATQVKISEPQKLTEKTMQAVEVLSQRKSHTILRIVSLTSSIAASFFIGLFVFEQFLPQNNAENRISEPIFIEKTTFTDLNALMQQKKERQKKQQTFNSIINKYKTLK